jgi:indolepyruvate ferredoxin oxidoreductase
MIPVLHPASIEDALTLGLHGYAMSRYAGTWVGFKIISDFADSSAVVDTDPFALEFKTPTDFNMPENGLNIRWYDPPVEQEARLVNQKLPAVMAYARANQLDRVTHDADEVSLAIVATGKAYMDTLKAFELLGLDDAARRALGIVVYKVSLVWPLEDHGIRALALRAKEILVVEEKRSLIEDQIKHILFNLTGDARPEVSGKTNPNATPLLPATYELSPFEIAVAIITRLSTYQNVSALAPRLEVYQQQHGLKRIQAEVIRAPWYCSGCPHNTSTKVPDGSRALAGIGCHYMAMWMDRSTVMFTQMGGEGVTWVGQAPFTDEPHIFANLGDGTYFHSGLLAIRASVAAKTNITYKILYNDAVAMTGGQPVDGTLTVDMIANQVKAEGVSAIYILSDDIEKYGNRRAFPEGIIFRHRDELDATQKEMRELKGCTILIYDQTCAAEKRRRRKRGLMEDPAKRIFINERVCEGCGDCGVQSNCLSLAPVETEFGRKRQIDQSSCNKDFSCVKGFCPSFVTILGGDVKKPKPAASAGGENDAEFAGMTEPTLPTLDRTLHILVTGIGGTGIVTIGALIAMAAHLEGKGATTMDQTGLAQKGGAVTSHVHLAATPAAINTVRIGTGNADLILGGDILVIADGDAMSKMKPAHTRIILNTAKTQTGEFTKNTEWDIPTTRMVGKIQKTVGDQNLFTLDATHLATTLLGNSIATNLFILGYAWQLGLIPLQQASIMRAIELNDTAIKMNQSAFFWGRRAAYNLSAVQKLCEPPKELADVFVQRVLSNSVDEMITRRVQSLTAYQSASYAKTYQNFVEKIRTAEQAKTNGKDDITKAVAKYLYKLMAYKDEYEVARLYTDGAFLKQLKHTFDGDYKIVFNLAPPLIAPKDKETGHLKKMEFGPWMLSAFSLLAKLRFLRGTPLDPFGYTAERKMERAMIKSYQEKIEKLMANLTDQNHSLIAEVAAIPEWIRGYGHVKERHVKEALEKEAALLKRIDALSSPPSSPRTEQKAA